MEKVENSERGTSYSIMGTIRSTDSERTFAGWLRDLLTDAQTDGEIGSFSLEITDPKSTTHR